MLERTIILPVKDNHGASLVREQRIVKNRLLAIAGGYSEVKQTGVWQEGGVTYRDTSWRVVVTASEEQDAQIAACLPGWCELLRQQCLYTHVTQITPAFVYPLSNDNERIA